MGNTINMSSSASHIYPNDYQTVGRVSTIRWGEVYEMKNSSTGQKVFMQERFTNDLETHRKNLTECKNRLSLSHSNLAGLLGFSESDAPDPSTNLYKINLYFEHVTTSLSDLVEKRASALGSTQKKSSGKKSSMHYFDEVELLWYLSQLVDVLSYLQMNEICLGDITPDVCFVTENGNIKIIDRKLIFSNISVFDLVKQRTTNVFPTPGELKAIENVYSRCAENRYKADLFRLGMTLVECATLKRSADVYDWRTQSISIEALSARLIEIRERYSTTFYNTLRELLRFDESKRSDFLMLNQRIQEDSAVSLDSTPSKVEEGQMRNSGVNKLKVTSPLASKEGDQFGETPSSKSPFKSDNFPSGSKMQNQEYSERGRGKGREEKVSNKEEALEDENQDYGDNSRANYPRYSDSRNSIDNSSTGYQNQPELLKKAGNVNLERIQSQGSAKKTPVKATTNENTPSKPIKIFGPIKSPEFIQSPQKIFSPLSRGMEKSKQALTFQSPEGNVEKIEKTEKMYSPFDHRPSNSDVTSPPISAQHFNFENLKNFPQLGKYTRSTVSEKSAADQRSSFENTLQTRGSPEKAIYNTYQSPNKPQIMTNSVQINELPVSGFSIGSYFSPKTQLDPFNQIDDPRSSAQSHRSQQGERSTKTGSPIQEVNFNMMGRTSHRETAQEKPHVPTFGGIETKHSEQDSEEFMDAYKMSFSNKNFVDALPAEIRQDRRIPADMLGDHVEILSGNSPKSPSFESRNSLPVFGGQMQKPEPRSFGLSAGAPVVKKEIRNSPAKSPVLGGEDIDERTMKIDDRFERAMQRSKRSEGFVKEMSKSLSRSPLRKE